MTIQEIDELLKQNADQAQAKAAQLLAAKQAALRAIDESEYMKAQRAAQEAKERERQAKLQSWRENALQPARKRLQATQEQYADWLDDVRAVQAQLEALQTRLNQMGTEIRSVAISLLNATVAADWVGAFASDEQMEGFVNAEVAQLPKVALAWLPFPELRSSLDSNHVMSSVRVDLHGHVTSRALQTPVQSFVLSSEELKEIEFKQRVNSR